MLGRTLLYTAVTRARRLVVVVGQRKALSLAVGDWRRAPRATALQGLLQGTFAFRWPAPEPAAGDGCRRSRRGPAGARRPDAAPADAAGPGFDLDPWEGLLTAAPDVS